MITDKAILHSRLRELCNYLNNNNETSAARIASKLKMGRWYMTMAKNVGIIYYEIGYWKGCQRLTDERLNKFIEISREYHKRQNNKNKLLEQCSIEFPKLKEAKVINKSKPVKKPTLIKRIKFLFTGQL